MSRQLSIEVLLGLRDRLTDPLRRATSEIEQLRQRAERVSALTARGALIGGALSETGTRLAAPLRELATAAMTFESAMADVKKVVDFETAEDFARLSRQIEELSRTIPLGAQELAEIAAAGGQFGLAAEDLLGYVEQVAKMSTAFDMTAGEAGEAMVKLANVYAIPIPQIGELGDAVNYLSNNMAASAPQIVEVLGRIGGTAAPFGLAKEQAAALSATLLALGETPERAGTALEAMLTKLQTAEQGSKAFQAALEGLGLSGRQMAAAIRDDAQGALLMLLGQLETLDEQSRTGALVNLFGAEHAGKIAKLAGNLDQYRTALDRVGEATAYAGSMQAEFESRSGTTDFALILLDNRVQELRRSIGEALLPIISDLAGRFGAVGSRIADWLREHPRLTAAIAVTAAVLAGLLIVGGGLVTALAGIIGSLALLKITLLSIGGAALLLNPVTLAIAALAALGVLIYRYWEPLKGLFSGLWAGLKEGLGEDTVEAIRAGFERALGWAKFLIDAVREGLAWIGEWLSAILAPVEAAGTAGEDLGRRWGLAIAGWITDLMGLVDTLQALPDRLMQAGQDMIDGLLAGLKAKWTQVKEWFAGLADGIPDWIRNPLGIRSPSRVFAVIGQDLMQGLEVGLRAAERLPRQALQGAVAGLTVAAVGATPALAAPAHAGAPAISMPIHISIQAPAGADPAALAALVRAEVDAAGRQAARRLRSALYDSPDDL